MLVVNHHKIINGIVPVEIINLDEFLQLNDESIDYGFEVSYKFKFECKNQENYENNIWKSSIFGIDYITEDNRFHFKVPSFLLSYKFEYKLKIDILKYKENEYDILSSVTSAIYEAEIPSILINTTYNINDKIQYKPNNAAYAISGTILQLMDDDKIKIQTDEIYDDLENIESITIVDASQVLNDAVLGKTVVDVTNKTKAETELVLRTTDINMVDMYVVLSNYLFSFYFNNMYFVEEENWNFRYIGSLIATYISQFLYEYHHNYRILCIFEDCKYLFIQQVWKYDIWNTYNQIKKGKDTIDLQDFRGTGFMCDICRCELSRYQFIYHCDAQNIHDYCIQCVYSVILQHNQMKQFIIDCLHQTLDHDCIDKIVTFCVGKVNKFIIY